MTDLHKSIMKQLNVDYAKARAIAFHIIYGGTVKSFSATDRGLVS